MTAVGRFAPSTTGPPHPGTLLAGLLSWLDIRRLGGLWVLRLEDLDPERSSEGFVDEMLEALAWLGLAWDRLERQSANQPRYAAALDRLAAEGRLYPCSCSRRELRASAGTTRDGTPRYPGTCRKRALPRDGWRGCEEPLRLRCEAPPRVPVDEDGSPLPGDWAGDPLLRRRDGAFAYHLASVVDDREAGVTRVVRGRDLAASTYPQCALQERLGFPRPDYRHHLLLLEERERKLAKFHGALSWRALRSTLGPEEVVAQLAGLVGLNPTDASALHPEALVEGFDWDRVSRRDCVVEWAPPELRGRPDVREGDSASAPRG